ncbi:MAG: type II toxin-antitoxin system RelE/ParE family toxin [Planctomycetota bacterium]
MYPLVHIDPERVQALPEFLWWFEGLRDPSVRRRVVARVDRLAIGNPGDCKMIDRNLYELRLHFGPGYRMYFSRRGKVRVLLLVGGDKWSQFRDIAHARALRDGERL